MTMLRQQNRHAARRKMLSCAALSVGTLTLLASGVAQALQSITVDTPNGHPFIELTIFDPGEADDLLHYGQDAPREVSDNEIETIKSALSYFCWPSPNSEQLRSR